MNFTPQLLASMAALRVSRKVKRKRENKSACRGGGLLKHVLFANKPNINSTTLQPILTPLHHSSWGRSLSGFITHLPFYKENTTILVIVDPSFTYTAYSVVELFSTMVCKLHGFPNSSNRDTIFTNQFWQALFKLNGATLNKSCSHHS